MSDDENTYCTRCWDNLRLRRYHSNVQCPYAPKPKSNEKPITINLSENLQSNEFIKVSSIPAQQLLQPHTGLPPHIQNQSQYQSNNLFLQSKSQQNQQHNNNNNNNNVFEIKKDLEADYCPLCWEYYRQRKYHENPNDCRATQKIKKKFKSYIK